MTDSDSSRDGSDSSSSGETIEGSTASSASSWILGMSQQLCDALRRRFGRLLIGSAAGGRVQLPQPHRPGGRRSQAGRLHPSTARVLRQGAAAAAAARRAAEDCRDEDMPYVPDDPAFDDFLGPEDSQSDNEETNQKKTRRRAAWQAQHEKHRHMLVEGSLTHCVQAVLDRNAKLHAVQHAIDTDCQHRRWHKCQCHALGAVAGDSNGQGSGSVGTPVHCNPAAATGAAREHGALLSPPDIRDVGPVAIMTLTARHNVMLREWWCEQCKQWVQPSPLTYGFFPSSPVLANYWIDLLLMRQYHMLAHKEAVSGGCFWEVFTTHQDDCATLDHLTQSTINSSMAPPIDKETWEDCYMAWEHAMSDATTLVGLGVAGDPEQDPLVGCGICSQLPESMAGAFALTRPPADKVAPKHTVGVGVDACCKANHLASSGKAVKHLQPHDCKNFGEANRLTAAYTKYRDGSMLLEDVITHGLRGPPCDEAGQPAVATGAAASAGTREEDGHGPTCDTDIHCARQAATAVKGTDVHGIVGMACSHGVPVRQSYVNMLTPENFGMYLLIFSSILPRLRSVRDVYVDFGCKLHVTWARYLAQERARPGGEEGPLSTQQSPHLSRVRILVNWMHASSHKLSCQLKHSARYTLNAARRVGEMMEQTWAMFKYPGQITRYMGLVNRQHFLDAHVNFISANKLPKQAEHLLTRIKRMKQLLPNYEDERERVLKEAGDFAAKDRSTFNETAAIQQFYNHIIPVATSDYQASVNEELENKKELLRLQWAKRSATLITQEVTQLAGLSVGLVQKLHRMATDASSSAKHARIVNLCSELNMNPLTALLPEDPEYKRVLKHVVTEEHIKGHLAVQQIILDIHQNTKSTKKETSGKASQLTKKTITRQRARIDEIVDEMNLWALIAGLNTVVVSEAAIKTWIKDGYVPDLHDLSTQAGTGWTHELGAGVIYGRQLCVLQADIARCQEEMEYLQWEVMRLAAWVMVMTERCEEELAVRKAGRDALCHSLKEVLDSCGHTQLSTAVELLLKELADSSDQGASAWGRDFHLTRHLLWLNNMWKPLQKCAREFQPVIVLPRTRVAFDALLATSAAP